MKDDPIHSEAFLARLMREQLRLSIACALAFVVALVALPLLNYLAPDLMARRVGGFTLSWLILGVLFFPYVWLLSWIFSGAPSRWKNPKPKPPGTAPTPEP